MGRYREVGLLEEPGGFIKYFSYWYHQPKKQVTTIHLCVVRQRRLVITAAKKGVRKRNIKNEKSV